jgi:hypothetical protein
MAAITLEDRVAELEKKVARLLEEKTEEQTPVPWWEQITGVFKDCPAFDEAERLGREWREAQRMEYDEDATPPA